MFKLFLATLLTLGWLTAEHFPPWVSWHNEVWVFVASAAWAVVGLAFLRARQIGYVVVPGIAWVVCLLLGVAWVQYAMGYIAFLGDILGITFYLYLCLLALSAGHYQISLASNGQQNIQRTPNLEYLAAVISLGAICSAGIALAQGFHVLQEVNWITPPAYDRRPGGNLAQPNQLATLLLMGLASLLYLFELRRLQALSTLIVAFLLIFGLAVTESRSGLLSFLALFAWWMARYRVAGFRATPVAIGLGSATFLAMLWYWPQFHSFVNSGGLAVEPSAHVNTGASLRVVVWPQLAEAAWQRPWFGWGLGQISKAHNAVVHGYALSEPYTYAHNAILDLAVGMGLPLSVLLVGAACVWIWRRIRAAQTLLPWYCWTLLLPVGVHSLLEFPFAYSYFLAPAMFAVGALEGQSKPRGVWHLPWRSTVALVIAVTATMAWSVLEYVAIEEDYRIGRFEAMHIGKTASDYERPKVHLLTQLDALLEVVRLDPVPGMGAQRIALLREVSLRFPYSAVQNRYALSMALNGDPEEAVRQLKVIRTMYGVKQYAAIRENWLELAAAKYPQLKDMRLP
jgi:O-antigen ligase